MKKRKRSRKFNTKKLLQKYLLVMFSLALVFSPFSSLGQLAYAEGDTDKADNVAISVENNDTKESSNPNDGDDDVDNTGGEDANSGDDEVSEQDSDTNGDTIIDSVDGKNNDPEAAVSNSDGENENSKENTEVTDNDEEVTAAGFMMQPLANNNAGTTQNGFKWELVAHLDVITITGYTGNDTEITIPSEIDGKEVRYIGGNAFESSQVEKVTVPNTVSTIGIYAFWKSKLKEIHLPDGLTNIRHSAFSQTKLTEIVLPNTLTNIDTYAFQGSDLSEITIPESVQTIGNSAFIMNNLETIHLPSTLTSVGDSAFQSNEITEVTIRNPELTLGENVFNGNYVNQSDLTIYGYTGSTAQNYAQTMGHTFESLNEKITHVHSLSALAVSHGTAEEDLRLPTFVEVTVEDVDGTTATITVPISEWSSTVYDAEEHGTYAFTGVLDLDSAIENPGDLKATIVVNVSSYAWEDNTDGVTITGYYGTNPNITIPDTFDGKDVTIIGNSAFKSKDLTSVVIPNPLKTIEREAFDRNSLTSISIPQNVKTIEQWAFRNNNIEKLTIPGNVLELGQGSFQENEIDELTINNGVETISNYAFSGNKITSVSIPESVSSIGRNPFNSNLLETITVDDNNQHYLSIDEKGLYTTDRKKLIAGTTAGIIKEGTETIEMNAFGGIGLTKIEIPESVGSVQREAFINNELENITFLNKDTVINSTAFRNNSIIEDMVILGYTDSTAHQFAKDNHTKFAPLEYEWSDDGNEVTITGYKGDETDITIPEEIVGMPVTVIGDGVFVEKGLTSVNLPETLEVIGPYAFGLNELATITIPKNVQNIMTGPFAGNLLEMIEVHEDNAHFKDIDGKGLYTEDGETLIQGTQSGEIAEGTTVIVEGAFLAIGLKGEINIPNSVQYIGPVAFSNADLNEKINNISKVEIPGNVEEIGEVAFFNVGLEELILHDGLEKIGSQAFANNSLTYVEIPSSVKIIDTSAFDDNKIEQLILHEGLERIEENAFTDNLLTALEIPSTVEFIGEQTFQGNKLEQIMLHEGLKEIDYEAFNDNSLTNIDIPSSVEKIHGNAFSNNNLEQVIIRAKNIDIGSTAFEGNQTNPEDLTIYGYKNSDVETFANDEGYTFIPFPYQLLLDAAEPYNFYSGEFIEIINSDGEIVGTMQIPAFDTSSPLETARLLIRDVAEGDVTATGLEIAGQIVDILFVSWEYDYDPDNPNEDEIINDEIEGEFILSLRVNDDATGDIDMYHEVGHDDWDNVGGYVSNGFITATVTDFSKYGVFAEETATIDIKVEKVWKGEPQDSVTVQLLANGNVEGSVELSESNDWKDKFTDLPLAASDGRKVEYTVMEVPVDGYESSITGTMDQGFVITNTEIDPEPEYIDIEFTKEWVGTPQESVTVYLLINGERSEMEGIVLTEDDDWTGAFYDMARYDSDGTPYDYMIEEEPVDGYETSITGTVEEGFVITNTEEEPTEPEDLEEPEDPKFDPCESQDPIATGCPEDDLKDDDKNQTTVTVEDDDKTTPKKGALPKTATNSYNILLASVILLIIGISIQVFVYRKNRTTQ